MSIEKNFIKEKPMFKGAGRFPQNQAVENELLGSLIDDPIALTEILPELTKELFFQSLNQKIFVAMSELSKKGTVDMLSIHDYMSINNPEEKGVLEYLGSLVKSMLYTSKLKEYKDILYRDMILRRISECGKNIVEASEHIEDYEECLDFAESQILTLSQKVSSNTSMIKLSTASSEYLSKLEKLAADRNIFKGLRTHYPQLDFCTDGLKKGNLIILAARPSVGKSSFALNIVSNLIENKEDKVIAFFSLEMPAEQTVQRLMSMMTSVTMKGVFSGEISESGFEELFRAHASFDKCNIYVDDRSLQTPNNIWSKCRRLKMLHGKIDLIVVDYLQLLNYNDPTSKTWGPVLSETTEVTKNSRMLKMIAMDLDCPVLALSQLSRSIEGRDRKEGASNIPKLSDLRQSGAIEQDADVVMFLAREKEEAEDKGKGYIILAIEKNRNGSLEKIMYKWDGTHVKFIEDRGKKAPMSE